MKLYKQTLLILLYGLVSFQLNFATDYVESQESSDQEVASLQNSAESVVDEWAPESTDEIVYTVVDFIEPMTDFWGNVKVSVPFTIVHNRTNSGQTATKITREPINEQECRTVIETWKTKNVGYVTTTNVAATIGALALLGVSKLGLGLMLGYYKLTQDLNEIKVDFGDEDIFPNQNFNKKLIKPRELI